jgi:hypothetical protein
MVWVKIETNTARRQQECKEKAARTFTNFNIGMIDF